MVWAHAPQQPTSAKGPWSKCCNELVMHPFQMAPACQTYARADAPAQQIHRTRAHLKRVPSCQNSFTLVTPVSHGMRVASLDDSPPIESVIYCSSCGTYAIR
eukprot:2061758-Amphidinium_carterae.1